MVHGHFHVADDHGSKLRDPALLSRIEGSLDVDASSSSVDDSSSNRHQEDGVNRADLMALELTGTDRPGRLSEVFAVASNVIPSSSLSLKSPVTVQIWTERGYSIVNVLCRDRSKLLFDVVCTLTDMDYVVFHGTLGIDADYAYQEFYIRHIDGSPISSEAEQQRVSQCLQAAIERRAPEGVRLELSMLDRRGLLAEVTHTFRENGLSVKRAEITTKGGEAKNKFWVTDTNEQLPDRHAINVVIEKIGDDHLKLKETLTTSLYKDHSRAEAASAIRVFNLGNIVMKNLYFLGLVRSCS